MIKLRSHSTVWAVVEPYGDVHLDRDGFNVTISYQGKKVTAYMPKEVGVDSLFDTISGEDVVHLIQQLEA